MATVRKGEKIICPNGHVCGELDTDVADGDTIAPDMLQLDLFEQVDFTDAGDAHFCKTCNERITEVRDGLYRVRTAQGWVGRFP